MAQGLQLKEQQTGVVGQLTKEKGSELDPRQRDRAKT